MSLFVPGDHLTVKHNYGSLNAWGFPALPQWQDFTGDLVGAQFTLREFVGTHSGALSFYRANMDPSQGSGTRVIKKGDKVRVHAENGSGTKRKMATFKVKRVSVAIDLKAPIGRQNRVTVHLRGIGVAGVGGTGGSAGVATPEELSNVVTGAPYVISGNDFSLTRSYAWAGTAHASTSAKSEPDGVDRVNGCTNPSFETNTTGWAASGTGASISRVTTDHFVGTASLQVVQSGSSVNGWATNTVTGLVVGATYTVSGYGKKVSGAGAVAFSCGVTGISDGTAVTGLTSTFTQASYTFVATATSHQILMKFVGVGSAFTALLDAVLVEAADVADTYFDGDTTDVTASGITSATDGTVLRTNLSTNPSFETNTTGYTAVTGATTLSRNIAGGFSGPCYCAALRTGSVTSESLSFTASGLTSGKTYTVSAYGQMAVGTAPKLQLSSTSVSGTQVSLSGGAWTRASVTFAATGATELITVSFTQTNSSSVAAGFDAVQIEQAAAATDYFDGTTTDTDSRLYAWTGTTNNSTSTETATFTEVATINDASELDQIVLTRDTNPGVMAFEDPDGTIQVFDSAVYRTAASSHTIDDTNYSTIDQQFDMSHIVNVLTVKYLEKIRPPATHGHDTSPTRTVEHDIVFTDAPSLAKYGPFKKTHKVHKKSDFAAYATSVFAKNADPQNVPASVTVPILAVADLLPGFEDGHYVGNKVDVVLPDGVTTYVCRVGKIHHQITPGTWTVRVFLHDQNLVQSHGVGGAGSGGSGKAGDTSRPGLSTEVGNNPDKYVLSAHIEDDIDGTGKTITAATFQTASGLGSGAQGMLLSNDTSGGVIKMYTGAGFETSPGIINPINTAGSPGLRIASSTTADGRARIDMYDDSITFFQPTGTFSEFTRDVIVDGVLQVLGVAEFDGNVFVATPGDTLAIEAPPTGGTANVNWNSANGNLRQITSARRFKTDIEPYRVDVEKALALEPQAYTRLATDEDEAHREIGFIAEDAQDLGLDAWVVRDGDGEVVSFDYFKWVVALQAIARSQQQELNDLNVVVTQLAATVAALTERLA